MWAVCELRATSTPARSVLRQRRPLAREGPGVLHAPGVQGRADHRRPQGEADRRRPAAQDCRAIKSDLRGLTTDDSFPRRVVVPVVIDQLPAQAPELRLSQLLAAYRSAREARLAGASKAQASAWCRSASQP